MGHKTILITGCSSGIGKYLAGALSRDGWEVISTTRKETDKMIQLDLADSHSIKAAVRKVGELTGGKLYALINNAGMAYFGKLENISRDDLRRQFEVNVMGVHELIQETLPLLRRTKGSRIINISSVNGRVSQPLRGAYSASKFALEALSDALRVELKKEGIKVSLIEPGSIKSDFRKKAIYKNMNPDIKEGKDPYIVYRRVKHALESKNPKIRYLAGQEYVVYLKNVLPVQWLDKILEKRMG